MNEYLDKQHALIAEAKRNLELMTLVDVGTGQQTPSSVTRDVIVRMLQGCLDHIEALGRYMEQNRMANRFRKLGDRITDDEVDLILQRRQAREDAGEEPLR